MTLRSRASLSFLALSVGLALLSVWLHATWTQQRLERLSALPLTAPFEDIQERTVLQFLAADGYAWLRQARDMVADGRTRLQFTHADNAPEGRAVAWSSGFAWWLAALKHLHVATSAASDARAWSWAAVWANPLLLLLALGTVSALLVRPFGARAAGLAPLAMLGCRLFYEGFLPGYPDHHGLIALASLGTLLGLLRAADGAERARGAVCASAFCGATGLWLSAVSQVPLLLAVGLAALATARLAEGETGERDARSWALWGRWGAGFTLGYYLLEHVPGQLGMQLPANHPLHALAWFGGGEVLAVLTRRLAREASARAGDGARLALGAGCLLALPAAILLGPASWWSLSAPFLAAVHARITEFQPLLARMTSGSLDLVQWAGPLPLVLVPGGVLLLRRSTPRTVRVQLALALGPALVFGTLSLAQTRWAALSAAPLLALLIVLTGHVTRSAAFGERTRWAWTLALAGALAWTPLDELAAARAGANAAQLALTREEARDLLLRDLAASVCRDAGAKPPVVLASPGATVRLCAFGTLSGLGTLYWENLDGLRAAAEIHAARSADEARALLRAHGVTHLVLVEMPGVLSSYIERYHELAYLARAAPALETTFAYRIFHDEDVPTWLRPIAYDHALLRGSGARVRLFEVVDG